MAAVVTRIKGSCCSVRAEDSSSSSVRFQWVTLLQPLAWGKGCCGLMHVAVW